MTDMTITDIIHNNLVEEEEPMENLIMLILDNLCHLKTIDKVDEVDINHQKV